MKTLLAFVVLTTALSASAGELFSIKKSYKQKNYLRFFATVENCKLVDVYPMWHMGEEQGQDEGLAFYEKPFFKPKNVSTNGKTLNFTFGALKKIQAKTGVGDITVELENCKAKAYTEIDHRMVELNEIFVEGTGSGLGFKLKALNVKGELPNGAGYFKKFAN